MNKTQASSAADPQVDATEKSAAEHRALSGSTPVSAQTAATQPPASAPVPRTWASRRADTPSWADHVEPF